LGRAYALLIQDQHPNPTAFLEAARQSGEEDIYLGALFHLERVPEHLRDFLKVVRAARDPWLQLIAEREQARHEFLTGKAGQAEQRLLTALASCDQTRLAYRCLDLAKELTDLYVSLYRLVEAKALASQSLDLAKRVGEWEFERQFLQELSEIARYRSELPLARVYLEESLARDPRQCAYVHQSLADLSMLAFDVEKVRSHMAQALQCGQPLARLGVALLAELSRFGLSETEVRHFHRLLAEIRRTPLSPGERVSLLSMEGQFEIERDRSRGQRLLYQAIAEADRLSGSDIEADKTRAHAYSTLIIDAGRAGEADRLLELVAASRRQAALPERCAVVVEDDHTRLLSVVRDVDGKLLIHFDPRRTHALGSGEGVIPEPQRVALQGCEHVRVLATPTVHECADLLPLEVAWSFQLSRTVHPPPRQGRLLVVHNAEPPLEFRLARLPVRRISKEEAKHEQLLELSGSSATPSRVLAAMEHAAEIEIHAHGIGRPGQVNGMERPDPFDTAFIALTPDSAGHYALTTSEIRRRRLSQAPLVLLAACGTAQSGLASHQPSGLPAAFIEAGASAVLAASVDIPDSAGTFFASVRRRIREGVPPPVALRDERAAWLAVRPQEHWVKHVFVFD
jgi:hypothetical protein